MTNVDKKTKSDDVQTHIKTSFEYINKHLPNRYVHLVQEKMKTLNFKPVTDGAIRNIRQKAKENKNVNVQVITAILAVAKDNATDVAGLVDSISNIE